MNYKGRIPRERSRRRTRSSIQRKKLHQQSKYEKTIERRRMGARRGADLVPSNPFIKCEGTHGSSSITYGVFHESLLVMRLDGVGVGSYAAL